MFWSMDFIFKCNFMACRHAAHIHTFGFICYMKACYVRNAINTNSYFSYIRQISFLYTTLSHGITKMSLPEMICCRTLQKLLVLLIFPCWFAAGWTNLWPAWIIHSSTKLWTSTKVQFLCQTAKSAPTLGFAACPIPPKLFEHCSVIFSKVGVKTTNNKQNAPANLRQWQLNLRCFYVDYHPNIEWLAKHTIVFCHQL